MSIPLTILSPVARERHHLNLATIQALANSGHFDLRLIECHGFSEVARARNRVATLGEPIIRKHGGLVLWLDADMTADVQTVYMHAQAVLHTSLAISGRAVTRQDARRLAASTHENETREPKRFGMMAGKVSGKLEPVLAGLACLMMPGEVFLEHSDRAPRERRKDRTDILLCCPRIEVHPDMGHVFISEDNQYSRELQNGTWMAELEQVNGHGSDGNVLTSTTWLDYGHVAERVLAHQDGPHKLNPGSYK